jgi:hypothetical protein
MTMHPRLLLIALALTLTLGCPAQRAEAPTETRDGQTTEPTGGTMIEQDQEVLSKEIYVLVSTSGGKFSVSPDPIVVQNSSKQTVIWFAEDPDVKLEIEYKDPERNPDPAKKPPLKPCDQPERKCGGKLVGGQAGTFFYTVRGTKGTDRLEDLDPELIILKDA